jgi:hypothetical protein
MQYLHWILQAGATGRWILPNLLCASFEKHGWVALMSLPLYLGISVMVFRLAFCGFISK